MFWIPRSFPEPERRRGGGLHFRELLEALLDIFARFNIVAFDNVELAPSLDPSGRSTALACKLLREELLALRIFDMNPQSFTHQLMKEERNG